MDPREDADFRLFSIHMIEDGKNRKMSQLR